VHKAGRLVSSKPEVEWDEQEQGWMLALAVHKANRCPGCGGDLTVTTKPEHDDAYRPDLPLQCHRCAGFARSHEAYKDHPHPQTLIHMVAQRPS
jgi:hypothetical protein